MKRMAKTSCHHPLAANLDNVDLPSQKSWRGRLITPRHLNRFSSPLMLIIRKQQKGWSPSSSSSQMTIFNQYPARWDSCTQGIVIHGSSLKGRQRSMGPIGTDDERCQTVDRGRWRRKLENRQRSDSGQTADRQRTDSGKTGDKQRTDSRLSDIAQMPVDRWEEGHVETEQGK